MFSALLTCSASRFHPQMLKLTYLAYFTSCTVVYHVTLSLVIVYVEYVVDMIEHVQVSINISE